MARRRSKSSEGYELHAHGCKSCQDRYEDACNFPDVSGLCVDCQTGRPVRWVLLILSRMPHDCCFTESRTVRKDEYDRYRLSKGCAWFICGTCKRTFPYRNPKEEDPEFRIPACCMYAKRVATPRDIERFGLDPNTEICPICKRTNSIPDPIGATPS